MIEAIAQRWFEQEPANPPPRCSAYPWAQQPEHLRDIYRRKAAEFWEQPGRLARAIQLRGLDG